MRITPGRTNGLQNIFKCQCILSLLGAALCLTSIYYLFILYLTASAAQAEQSRMTGLMNNELERMWQEGVVA
jgi:hypothetical protein